MQRTVRIAIYVLLGSITSSGYAAGSYVYYNCADQQPGIPLAHCATLSVDETLSRVMIIDNGTSSAESGEDPDYFAVRSPLLPLAVPRRDYGKISEWSYRGVAFKKVVRNFSVSLLGSKIAVDVISATQHGSVSLTFWFSESSGVLAVAFPARTQNGAVYYCSGAPCLFAK
jgi:hypothetical protein